MRSLKSGNKIKVMYLRSSFDPGGTESLLKDIFNYDQPFIEFHYALLKDGSLIAELESSTNKYYRVFRKRKIDLTLSFRLLRILRKEQINIIHTHQLIEFIYALLVKIYKPRLKIIRTFHGYQSRPFIILLEKLSVFFCWKTVTVSNAAKEKFRQIGYHTNKMQVVYNFTNELPHLRNEDLEALFRITGEKKDAVWLCMIGNFVWWKDQLTIIDAFKKLKVNNEKLKLLFFGNDDTEHGNQCKNAASDLLNKDIFFLGRMKDASKYIPLMDLFVFSTLDDTFGIALVEALKGGIKTIASDIPVCREISEDGELFPLFKTGDSENLVKLITNILSESSSPKLDIDLSEYTPEFHLKALKLLYTI